jgi:hypothetical protein
MKMTPMKLISIKRVTRAEKRYSNKMGIITVDVTYVKNAILNIPVKILHKYRETYYGEVKDCEDCKVSA